MPVRLAAVALVLLLVAPACQTPPPDDAPVVFGEPTVPPVFRSVLDERPRMLTMRLDDTFWVAYSAETGGLYRVWTGGVDFDGAVYTTAHGPQPVSVGPAYLVDDALDPWRIVRDGETVVPEVQYQGHAFRDGATTLRVRLDTPSGSTVSVTETPTYVEDGGRPGLRRVFTVEGAPEGTDVAIDVTLRSLAAPDGYETDGDFEVLSEEAGVIHGLLTLASDGPTVFTSYFGEPTVPGPEPPEDDDRPEGLALIERSDCVACHNPEVQTVGPAYRTIAAKYEPSDANVEYLVNRVVDGGSGVWGAAAMTPHPDLPREDVETMVRYILSLREESGSAGGPLDVAGPTYPFAQQRDGTNGLVINLYPILADALDLDDLQISDEPYYSGIVPALHVVTSSEMGEVGNNFYAEATGFLDVPERDNYVLRLVSDDGSRLYLDGELLIDHDGLHAAEARDAELILDAGRHPIRVEYFQAGGDGALSLQWARSGAPGFSVVPPGRFTFEEADLREAVAHDVLTGVADLRPGDRMPLEDVHPSFVVETIRPEAFHPKVGGLDVMADGRVVVSTWDPSGSVYILSNLDAEDPDDVEVRRFASGLAEPLGLKVVDGEIYVLQKQELTRLVDTDGDGEADVYETVGNDWGATANFHEFAFGLAYRDGAFYASLATAILPGGASADPQNPDRGSVIRIDRETGEVDFVARGLRTPNGIAFARGDELFVADNQGDWLPASKIVRIREGGFYGSRSVDFEGTEGLEAVPPVVWLPQDEIGNSPSQPAPLDVGPYVGQLIHGEVTHGGIKRVFAEEVDGVLQGAVFRFTQGLEAGVNRIAWGPEGALYVGGVGNPGNWGHAGKLHYGLQRLRFTGAPVFEMLAVRAQPDGFEIEFTEPLAQGAGEDPAAYAVRHWYYEPTADYGGPKLGEQALTVESVTVSDDRRRARLVVSGLRPGHVVYFRLDDGSFRSGGGRSLWSTEAWYTLNRIP